MYLDNITASVQLHRDTAQKLYMAPSLAFTPLQTSMQDYCSNFHAQVPHTHAHTHPFNVSFSLSGTTQVSQHQKGKTNLDFTEARDSEWQWHQLVHMQVCTSLQTDNYAGTPPLSFLQADALSAAQPIASQY